MKYSFIIFAAVGIFLILPSAVSAHHLAEEAIKVRIMNTDGETTLEFQPFDDRYRAPVSVARGDLGTDDVPEFIIGSGGGVSAVVKLFDIDGAFLSEIKPYGEATHGVNLAVCDTTGDGTNEIIAAPMYGGSPSVQILNSEGEMLGAFHAYHQNFLGGVNIACGDVDSDGTDEIITGAGITGGPHIKVFESDGSMVAETFAGSAYDGTGVDVAVGDTDGDGDMEIISGRMGIGDPTVMVFNLQNSILRFIISMPAFENYRHGLEVSAHDVDGDGMDEIGVATRGQAPGSVQYLELTGNTVFAMRPFGSERQNGLALASAGETENEIVLANTPPTVTDKPGKYINIDDAAQTLYAYENGVLLNAYLVSTGLFHFPSPRGKYGVMKKLLWHDYVWSYGPGNPNNYSLPNVKYNLRFKRHYYIHYAYWHDNFGHRMSHGCINAPFEAAEWTYNWADVGTTVEVVN